MTKSIQEWFKETQLNGWIPAMSAYTRYCQWTFSKGHPATTLTRFGRDIKELVAGERRVASGVEYFFAFKIHNKKGAKGMLFGTREEGEDFRDTLVKMVMHNDNNLSKEELCRKLTARGWKKPNEDTIDPVFLTKQWSYALNRKPKLQAYFFCRTIGSGMRTKICPTCGRNLSVVEFPVRRVHVPEGTKGAHYKPGVQCKSCLQKAKTASTVTTAKPAVVSPGLSIDSIIEGLATEQTSTVEVTLQLPSNLIERVQKRCTARGVSLEDALEKFIERGVGH